MKHTWLFELKRISIGLAGLLVAGLAFGRLLLFLLSGFAAYLCWQLFNLYRLHRWLESPGGEPPSSRGIWASVYADVYRIRARDARRRKRMREILTDFRQAAAASPDAAVILRDNGEIAWINAAATRLLGLRHPQDLNQMAVNLIRDPEFARYIGDQRYGEPLQMRSPVDDSINLLIRVVPYGGDRRLMMVRDVTRLHRLEQMRKDFVANVSHELRSPLTVIVGYLETLTDDESTPENLRRPLQQMAKQADRMCLIVEDLLRLSQIENQPGGAPKISIPVAEMLERIRIDAAKLGDGMHAISVESDSGTRLLGEYNELYSAFSNLVFNAVQYTPEDGEIFITWAGTPDGAKFEVRDTGIGIEPHHVPRLTERFYRIDKARSREIGGTGLGLAIVKHVLLRHDASLNVQSVPGRGSTFSCVFPPGRTLSMKTTNMSEHS